MIPVVWHEGPEWDDKRAHYAITTLLNDEILDGSGLDLLHCHTMAELPADAAEGIVIIHGEHEHNQFLKIAEDLCRLQRVIIVLTGDDAASFPSQNLLTPGRKLWQQMPIPGKHDRASRLLICGYPADAKTLLEPHKNMERDLDWSFAGQITHQRRFDCVEQLRKMPNGLLKENSSFWFGMERPEYYKSMARSKIIPCPSGPVTPDTIRLSEALEAGCLPLADGTCARQNYPNGYWQYVLGCEPPFPIIDDWGTLPEVMERELARWPYNRDIAVEWWQQYKQSLHTWLWTDLEELRRQ